jgi:putative zinc finger/helix-turn-helix YgiT family protein
MDRFTLENQAHRCGGTFQLIVEPGTFRIHGLDVAVNHRFFRCSGCGEELVTEDLAELVQGEAATAFRRQENFLSGTEIRSLRERLGLSQEQLEGALGLGAKSLARWENDRVLQNRSMDNLFRAIERDPGCLTFLAGIHGFELPQTPILARMDMIDSTRWPRLLVSKLSAMALAQGTDLHTYVIWLLTEFTTAGSFSAQATRELLQELSNQFQEFASRDLSRIRLEEEELWKRPHEEAMREYESNAA